MSWGGSFTRSRNGHKSCGDFETKPGHVEFEPHQSQNATPPNSDSEPKNEAFFLCLFTQVAWRSPVLLAFNLWALQYFANIRSISCGDSADSIAINSQEFARLCVCVCMYVCDWLSVWLEVSFNWHITLVVVLVAAVLSFALLLVIAVDLFGRPFSGGGRVWQGGDECFCGRDLYGSRLAEGTAWLIKHSANKFDP